MTEKSDLPSFLLDQTPWGLQDNNIWQATTFTLRRNLLKYDFPSKISKVDAQELLSRLKKILFSLKEMEFPIYIKAPELSTQNKEFLYEHFLCLEGFINTINEEAFVLDSSAKLLLLLNIEDHLQIHLIDSTANLEENYHQLSQIEEGIGSVLDFAFNPEFGYLTSDPGLAGTALVVNSFLHLPALIHMGKLPKALEQLDEDVFASGLEGSANGFVGDLVILSNMYTLGYSEEHILHSLKSSTLKLMAAEQILRTHLSENPSPILKDLIGRAYGLLTHSLQLETKETLNALSLLQLGLELNWASGVSRESLNKLFFQSRRAHLERLYQKTSLEEGELDRFRATYIHKQLKDLSLRI